MIKNLTLMNNIFIFTFYFNTFRLVIIRFKNCKYTPKNTRCK